MFCLIKLHPDSAYVAEITPDDDLTQPFLGIKGVAIEKVHLFHFFQMSLVHFGALKNVASGVG
jgi:hypothetical protein